MEFEAIKNGSAGENKQRINLSDFAIDTILQDEEELFPFYIKDRERKTGKPGAGKDGISSTVINHIVTSFFEKADATIPLRLQQREQELDRQLAGTLDDTTRGKAVQTLLADYRRELEKKRDFYLQLDGSSFNVRLSTRVTEKLADSSLYEQKRSIISFYDNRVGKYLKVLLEEYARMKYADRELFVAAETISSIENAINGKKVLKLTLRKDFREEYMKAYRILRDDEGLYNYVTGYVSEEGKAPWTQKVMRISDIEKAAVRSGSGFLSQEDRSAIENAVKKKGPQFISEAGNCDPIDIVFTPEGERLYKRIRHLRPQYVKKIAPQSYWFACSRTQAMYYFFKFGADARILSPKDLADEFREKYTAAAESYRK